MSYINVHILKEKNEDIVKEKEQMSDGSSISSINIQCLCFLFFLHKIDTPLSFFKFTKGGSFGTIVALKDVMGEYKTRWTFQKWRPIVIGEGGSNIFVKSRSNTGIIQSF